MKLRFCLLLSLALGCSGTVPDVPDVSLFDARDVIIDPRDGAAPDDTIDVLPTVDVVVFDVPAVDASFDVPSPDASPPGDAPPPPPDAARPDAPPPDGPSFDLVVPEDAPMTPCSDLAERYAAAVREAQSCGAAGCEARVCETLCCTCEVFISGTMERMRQLDDLRGRATALGCQPTLGCPTTRCPPARSGACSADGRCVTLRDPPDAAAPDTGADR